jgi:hypothetical protein
MVSRRLYPDLPGRAGWSTGKAPSKENTMIDKLQQFVRRLVEDQAFRDTVTRDPEGAVSVFGLVGPERHGALKLCAQVAGPSVIVPEGHWF